MSSCRFLRKRVRGLLVCSLSLIAITQVARSACVPAPFPVIGWWPGEGNAGDLTGSYPGILVNGTTFEPGRVGQAFRFDGIDDCVSIPYGPGLISDTFTVEAWVKPLSQVSDPQNQDIIFGQSFGRALLVARPGTTGLRIAFEFWIGGTSFPDVIASTEIPIDVFSHVAGTWDGTSLHVYINGVLRG